MPRPKRRIRQWSAGSPVHPRNRRDPRSESTLRLRTSGSLMTVRGLGALYGCHSQRHVLFSALSCAFASAARIASCSSAHFRQPGVTYAGVTFREATTIGVSLSRRRPDVWIGCRPAMQGAPQAASTSAVLPCGARGTRRRVQCRCSGSIEPRSPGKAPVVAVSALAHAPRGPPAKTPHQRPRDPPAPLRAQPRIALREG